MTGYYGTNHQRELQRRAYEMRDWIAATPGVYNAGRFIGVDEPDSLEPGVLARMLERDGILGLRMISPQQAARHFPPLEAAGCRIDSWDIIVGDANHAGERARVIAGDSLPEGIELLPPLDEPGSSATVRVQEFLVTNGLAPFPGVMLAEQPPRAKTIVLSGSGGIAATGHAYFPHNSHSRFRDHAWIGLVAVEHSWRGKGLGTLINALLVRAAFEELGARYVYEMVAPANIASRRMVEACGLRLDPELRCGVAVPAEARRFTR